MREKILFALFMVVVVLCLASASFEKNVLVDERRMRGDELSARILLLEEQAQITGAFNRETIRVMSHVGNTIQTISQYTVVLNQRVNEIEERKPDRDEVRWLRRK